jgi:hypothetical protein
MEKMAMPVLELLLGEDRPWALEELAREVGDRVETIDAVADLHGHGLVNRIGDEFVIASRAALSGRAMQEGEA